MSPRSLLPAIALLALTIATVVPSAAIAGPQDHADGFFLRLATGMGGVRSSIDTEDGEMKITGVAGDLNVAIGAVIRPDLAVHGTLYGWYASEPDVEQGELSGELDGDVTASGIGAGLTYYLMPANVYLSASVGVGSMEVDFGNMKAETDSGLLLDLSVGKEWWVGEKWGLGAGLGLQYHSFPDGDIDENWSGLTYCLRFSATMN